MLNVLIKLRNKRGFTLIEIIIAVAIIGLMSAIAVPSFINSNRRAEITRSSDYAEGFYFALQQAITPYVSKDGTSTELELYNGTDADGDGNPDPFSRLQIETNHPNKMYYVYAVAEAGGEITYFEVNLYDPAVFLATAHAGLMSGAGAEFSMATDPTGALDSVYNANVAKELVEVLKTNLKNSGGDGGFYYAMFDVKFRVAMAYYSKFADRPTVFVSNGDYSGKSYFFHTDGTICNAAGNDTFTFGAFPNEYRFVNSARYPNPRRQWYDVDPNL